MAGGWLVNKMLKAAAGQGRIKRSKSDKGWEDLDASTSGQLLIGDGSDIDSVAMSGDATITGAGVLTIGADKIDPGMVQKKDSWVIEEDFNEITGGTLITPWASDMETANVTGDFLADTANGVWRILTDSTSEAQAGQLTFGDQLLIDPAKNPVVEFRVKFSPAGATLTADERVVIGLVSAHANAENDLDSTTNNVWFRIEGANLNILVEADDGTTDTDDQDSTIDIVKGDWTHFKIDLSDLSDIKYYVDGVEQGGATVAAALLSATMQIIVCHQRDAGTEANSIDIDWIRVYQDRA